jgi:hypothetical protein
MSRPVARLHLSTPRLLHARPMRLQPSGAYLDVQFSCPNAHRGRIPAPAGEVGWGQASGSTPVVSATSIAQAAAFHPDC